MDGWNTTFILGLGLFSVCCQFQGVYLFSIMCWNRNPFFLGKNPAHSFEGSLFVFAVLPFLVVGSLSRPHLKVPVGVFFQHANWSQKDLNFDVWHLFPLHCPHVWRKTRPLKKTSQIPGDAWPAIVIRQPPSSSSQSSWPPNLHRFSHPKKQGIAPVYYPIRYDEQKTNGAW